MFKKHLKHLRFYPRTANFTHALHVMHVTNIMSVRKHCVLLKIVMKMIVIVMIMAAKKKAISGGSPQMFRYFASLMPK